MGRFSERRGVLEEGRSRWLSRRAPAVSARNSPHLGRRNHAIRAATSHRRKEDTNMSTPEDDEAAEYQKDLSEVVDDIEERVAEKHRPESAPDTAAERTDTIPDDAGDEAPD